MVWFPVMFPATLFHSPSFILLTELQYADIYDDSQYTHKQDDESLPYYLFTSAALH